MKNITLNKGKLVVKGEMTDIFEVKAEMNRKDFIMDLRLIPNRETEENGVEEIFLDVDLLNETVPEVLKQHGYMIVDSKYFN